MKHRIISILTALALSLSLCPIRSGALEGAPGPAHTGDSGYETAPDTEITASPGVSIEALIAALPDTVTEDNADDVRARLDEILALYRELNEEEQGQLDLSRVTELQGALDTANTPMPAGGSTDQQETSVASVKIGENITYYDTIDEAWTEAKGNTATITLLKDIETNTKAARLVQSGDDITISGGNHTLTLTYYGNYMFRADGGKLTIKDGTFSSPNSSGEIGAVHVYNSGEVIINGCTFDKNVKVTGGTVTVANSTIQSYVSIDGSSTVTFTNSTVEQQVTTRTGTVTFNSGTFQSYVTVNSGTVTFNNGEFQSHVDINSGTVTFNGGTVQEYVHARVGTTTFNGGTVNREIAVTGGSGTVGGLLGEGYSYVDKDDNIIEDVDQPELSGYGAITVKPTADITICEHDWDSSGKCTKCQKQAVASVTIGDQTSYYPILQSAVNAANKAAIENSGSVKIQITLLTELTASGGALSFISPSAGEMTLDGNGKTLNGYSVRISSAGGGEEIIALNAGESTKQSSGGKVNLINCTIKAKGGRAVVIEGGDVHISGCTFTASSYGLEVSGGAVHISDCIFEGSYFGLMVYGGDIKIDSGTFTGKAAIFIQNFEDVSLTLADLLAENRFYFDGDGNMVKDMSGTTLPADFDFSDPPTEPVTYTVGPCEHKLDSTCKCTVCGLQMAAAVTASGDTVYHTSIEDAWAAAKAAKTATVNLLQDVTVTDTLTVEDGENITLTSAENSASEDKYFSISRTAAQGGPTTITVSVSGGNLRVESGKIQMAATGEGLDNYFALRITGGAAEITGGAISADGGTQGTSYGVYVTGGAANISGGKITATGGGNQNTGVLVTDGTATISGGAISATGVNSTGVNVLYGTGTAIISGGAISATGDNSVGLSGWSEDNVKLTGGTFQGAGNAIECALDPVSFWLERTDAAHYACYQNDSAAPMQENEINVNALTGKVTVKLCESPYTYTHIDGTETHKKTCSACGYEITVENCAYDQQKTDEQYKVSDATCTTKAKYYKSCVCGVKTPDKNNVFEGAALGHKWTDATCTTPKTCSVCKTTEGAPLGHDWAAAWSSDETSHWHTCGRCGEKNEAGAHTYDSESAVTCNVCGYMRTLSVPERPQTYTITYNANGGSGTMANGTAIEKIAFTLSNCGFIAPDGKVFDTWFIGGTAVKPGEKFIFTGDTTVRAIWKDAPAKSYTVSYDANGGSGDVPPAANMSERGTFPLPENPLTREGYQFSGWGHNGVSYEPGTVFTMPAHDVTFTAQWTQIAYEITGVVRQDGNGVPAATVRLMRGAQEVTRRTTDENGQFTFDGVPVGIYNLIAEKEGTTKTVKQEITTGSVDLTIALPVEKISSVVEVRNEATPPVVVGALDKVFEDTTVYTPEDEKIAKEGGSVEFKLTVEKQDAPACAIEIEAVKRENEKVGLYLDLNLIKTVTKKSGEETSAEISEVRTLIETIVPLPPEMQGKASYTVYRVHNGVTEPLPKDSGEEYYTVSGDKKSVSIFARKYSTYAITWAERTETPPTPPTPSTPSGSSGGGGGSSRPAIVSRPVDAERDCPSSGFTDLGGAEAWYHEAVDFVLQNGLMNGYSETLFGPNENLSRAQLAQILYNREGRPNVTGGGVFNDVTSGEWYAPSITWAAGNGIVSGYGNNTFGPNDSITREQLAVMLWRYAGNPAATDKELHFTDADKVSGYAREALRWAVENGILNGRGGGILDPRGLATRAETAQMLKNFLENTL